MADQAQGIERDLRQAIFNERLEALFDHDFRQHRIARLFQAQNQLLADGVRLQKRRLPEAFSTL